MTLTPTFSMANLLSSGYLVPIDPKAGDNNHELAEQTIFGALLIVFKAKRWKVTTDEVAVLTDEIIENATRFCKNPRFRGVCLYQSPFGVLLTLPMLTDEDKKVEPLESRDGTFSYVYNIDAPDCSELGYSFFERDPITGLCVRIA